MKNLILALLPLLFLPSCAAYERWAATNSRTYSLGVADAEGHQANVSVKIEPSGK